MQAGRTMTREETIRELHSEHCDLHPDDCAVGHALERAIDAGIEIGRAEGRAEVVAYINIDEAIERLQAIERLRQWDAGERLLIDDMRDVSTLLASHDRLIEEVERLRRHNKHWEQAAWDEQKRADRLTERDDIATAKERLITTIYLDGDEVIADIRTLLASHDRLTERVGRAVSALGELLSTMPHQHCWSCNLMATRAQVAFDVLRTALVLPPPD